MNLENKKTKSMSLKKLLISILFLFFALSLSRKGIANYPEPPNIGILKQSIRAYIDSGSYQNDLEKVCNLATIYLYENYNKYPNPAAVFDVDETLLSNLEYMYRYDFGYNEESWQEWVIQAKAKAINPVKKLYQLSQKLNISIFIITGRKQIIDKLDEDPTIINLKNQGYYGWKKIFLKPINCKMSTVEFKTNCRKEIESQGYTIIMNVGDQWSDLLGGYSKQIFKLPNPFYYIP